MKPAPLIQLLSFASLFVFASSQAQAARVLYIGDSHSYLATHAEEGATKRLGHVLLEGLKGAGHELDYYAACGSAPKGWANGGRTGCGYTRVVGGVFESKKSFDFPRLASLDPKRFTHYIVNLGDNLFNWERQGKFVSRVSRARVSSELSAFFEALGTTTPENCTWVGPTYHLAGASYHKTNEAVDELYAALKTALAGKCRLLDSRAIVVTKTPSDGLHHVSKDSAAWGEGILRQLGKLKEYKPAPMPVDE